jgi:GT2 family glycosyltransferase
MVASLAATIPAAVRYELILVDDGSTDGTRAWLAGLATPGRVILNETNLGFGGATNRGAAEARGSVLALLNNDLVLEPGWLEPMLGALRSLGRRAGVVGNLQYNAASGRLDHAGIRINLKGKPEHVRAEPTRLERALRPVRPAAAATGACLLVRTETWRRLGGFDPAFVNGCEDVDLCLRARRSGLRNAVALRSRVRHHISASPGRKRRDEENTRRLVFKWRDELITLASREWTWTYFRPLLREPRDFPDPAEALRLAAYLGHLRRTPPASARAGMGAALDTELARWWEMFSD